MNKQLTPIKLGLLAPLTGLVGLYGPEISWAAQIAVKEVNDAGGINGRPLALVIEDDGSIPETAVPAAHKLVHKHGCSAIIGNLLSNSRIAVNLEVAEVERIPYLNFSFYEGSISGRYFFHFAALPNQQIDKMVPFMAHKFGLKFFFAGANYEWPRGSIDACKRSLMDIGGEVVGEKYFPLGTTDFSPLMYQLSTSGADVFVPYFAGSDQMRLLEQFTQHDLKSRMAVVMGHYDEAMVQHLPPDIREGFYSSNTYFMGVNSEQNQRYLNHLSQLDEVTGLSPQGNGVLTNFGEGTYICVMAFAAAAAKAQTVDAERLVDELKHVEILAPQGTVKMDPDTHHAYVNSYISQCNKDGSFSIIKSFGQLPPKIPHRYRNAASTEEAKTVKYSESQKNIKWTLISVIKNYEDLTNASPGVLLENIDKNLAAQIHKKITHINSQIRSYNQAFIDHKEPDGSLKQIKLVPLHNAGEKPDLAIYENVSEDFINISSEILASIDAAVIAVNPEGVIIETNTSAGRLFGYKINELIGLHIEHLIPPKHRKDHQTHFNKFATSPDTQRRMGTRSEISGYRKDGSEFPAQATISKFTSGDRVFFTATIVDIRAQKEIQENLAWQATHDTLTHLPNRALFHKRLQKALQRSQQYDTNIGVIFLDLDRFKTINDIFGHDFGDLLLVATSERLLKTIGPGNTLARFGGDELIILCDKTEDQNNIEDLCNKILHALKEAFLIQGQHVYISCSIGYTFEKGSSNSATNLIRDADTAMYKAKESGRNRAVQFQQHLRDGTESQLNIANGLRSAIEKNEFCMHIQPILETQTQSISGGEALLRWNSASGPISPAIFIPIAESMGLMHPIGDWVIEQTCRYISEIREAFVDKKLQYISINISAVQLNTTHIADFIIDTCNKYKVKPQWLLLEVTETAVMQDVNLGTDTLKKLGRCGFQIAIDDFGTGYTSLSQLSKLPLQYLKIDRMFINELETNESGPVTVFAIISLAHAIGMKVVAEGVENKEQLTQLDTFGCDKLQGFYFYKPMPTEEFKNLLI